MIFDMENIISSHKNEPLMRVNVPHLTFKGLRSAVGRDSRVNGDAQSFVQTFYRRSIRDTQV
jgi:hypothetical protein